jgi:heat shock protein HtpX
MLNVYEQIEINKRKSLLVMILFVVFIVIISFVFSQVLDFGLAGVGLALIFAGFTSFASYWWSDKIILTISGAKPASREKDFNFYTAVENLSIAAQVPKPKLYVVEDTAMNAFATGRDPDHAVVCATRGLTKNLNRSELEGVIAHEITHIQNFDMRLMSVVTILVGTVTLLADWFLRGSRVMNRKRSRDSKVGSILMLVAIILALLSPIIASLIKLAISRRREYLADAGSAKLTRQPDGLINALAKLNVDREPLEAANKATAHLYIANPLKNVHPGIGWFASLFNTHPPIEERIKALKRMT